VETFLTFEPRAIRRINKEQALRVNDTPRDRNPILFHFAISCTAITPLLFAVTQKELRSLITNYIDAIRKEKKRSTLTDTL